jgi:predicted Zn finger-like uncharacterized protein
MIVRCPDCRTKYEIAAEKVPESGFKLRCPRCKAVFPVSLGIEGRSPLTGPAPESPPAEAAGSAASGPRTETRNMPLPGAPPPSVSPPRAQRPRVTDPALARRMARAMISEMVLNRRSERDEALRSGSMLRRFGPAIVSAHDAYCSRVSPELAPAPRIFREAVNEILGEGNRLL